jgi:hypothetical protein
MHDLRHYRYHDAARDRLELITSTKYVGAPYFTDTESNTLLVTVIEPRTGRTLDDDLDAFSTRKLEEKELDRMQGRQTIYLGAGKYGERHL